MSGRRQRHQWVLLPLLLLAELDRRG